MCVKPILLAAATGLAALPCSRLSAACADLALVLAIDSSGSITDEDFAVQRSGYAAAFQDRRVQTAMASAGVVDVAVVVWGEEDRPAQVLPWRRISAAADTDALSRDILSLPRVIAGDTVIGDGLWTALDLIGRDQACAARRIINVSGDGRESWSRKGHHVSLAVARARAEAMNVTVNGLAILTHEPDLADWYRRSVITGNDAFVMQVDTFATFGDAIIRKLEREIALPSLAAADFGQEE